MAEFGHHAADDVLAVLDAANELLNRVDFSRLLTDEVMRANSAVAMLAGRTRLVQTNLAGRMQQLADEGRTAPPEDLLGRGSGMGNDAAARISRHARLLDLFPVFATALADGAIAEGHLDALAAHYRQLNDSDQAACVHDADRLAQTARRLCAEDFRSHLAKIRRENEAKAGVTPEQRQKRRNTMTGGIDSDVGRWLWNLNLDPVAGERLHTALEAEMKRLVDENALDEEILTVPSRLRAQALSNLVSSGFQIGRRAPSDGAACEVGVLMDLETWRSGLHENTICQTRTGLPVEIEEAKRLLCDASIYRVVLNDDSVVIDLGARQRLATAVHRRALNSMYETCGAHRCRVPFHECQIHHVEAANGSNTLLANLVPLCHRHHHLVHDNGWRAVLSADRVLTLQRPDGTWDEPQPLRPLGRTGAPAGAATGPPGEPSGSPGDPPGQGDLFAA